MRDLLYSFGIANPGAIVLHNFPRFLQEFMRPDGKLMDIAATDILRSRELGVPRYNEFRRLLHLRPGAGLRRRSPTTRRWRERMRDALRRRHRAARPDRRHVRREAARGVRVQRHRVPDLHPDGVAADQQRPVPHRRLHGIDVHPGRDRLGRGHARSSTCSSGTTPTSPRRCASSQTASSRGRRWQGSAPVPDTLIDVPALMAMSQAELDATFRREPCGRHPGRRGRGHRARRAGHRADRASPPS